MDSRARLTIGGIATVAVSVAVVSVVVMSSSAAMQDAPGKPVGSSPVAVPSPSPTPSASPKPRATIVATAPAPSLPTADAAPETVPAPEPGVVGGATQSPVTPVTPAEAGNPTTADRILLAIAATGSRQAVLDWAARHGWTTQRVEAWITRWAPQLAAGLSPQGAPAPRSLRGDLVSFPHSSRTVHASGFDLLGTWSGMKREQSHIPPG